MSRIAHGNVTLVWGYRDKKPSELRELIMQVQGKLKSLERAYPTFILRQQEIVHVTVLGCEAQEYADKFYSIPLLKHLFGTHNIHNIPERELKGVEIDFDKLLRILNVALEHRIRVKFGGYIKSSWPPLLYPGWSLYTMSFYFGFLAPNFVITGWPTPFWGWQLMGLRTLAEQANIIHKYHTKGEWPPDGDAYAVLGGIKNIRVAPHPRNLSEIEKFPNDIHTVVEEVREWLVRHPIEIEITKKNVEFIAYKDPQLLDFYKRKPLCEITNGNDIRDMYFHND